jgi:hypothetical protein
MDSERILGTLCLLSIALGVVRGATLAGSMFLQPQRLLAATKVAAPLASGPDKPVLEFNLRPYGYATVSSDRDKLAYSFRENTGFH